METQQTGYEAAVVRMIKALFGYRSETPPEFDLSARLTEDLDLDSLELAELSSMLEDEFGRDPYTAGVVPETVGDVIGFFED